MIEKVKSKQMRKDWDKNYALHHDKGKGLNEIRFPRFSKGVSGQAEAIMRETGAGDTVGKGGFLGADCFGWGPG